MGYLILFFLLLTGCTDDTKKIDLFGSRNEVIHFTLNYETDDCIEFEPSPISVEWFKRHQITTTHKSFKGAVPGKYFDPLTPVLKPCTAGDYWADVKLDSNLSPGDYTLQSKGGELEVSIKVGNWVIPGPTSLPGLIQLPSFFLHIGHYGSYTTHQNEVALRDKYAKALVDHRLSPMLHFVSPYTDQWKDIIPISGKYVVFPIRADGTTSGEWNSLTALRLSEFEGEAKKLLNQGKVAVSYLFDEPFLPRDRQIIEDAAKLIKKHAPSVKVMVTDPFDVGLKTAGVDIFAPVFQQYTGLETWGYVSCMSHGCGGEGDSGEPDLGSIERNPAYIRSFFPVAFGMGMDAALYYNAVEVYRFFKTDPFDTWLFTGYGDGTLFYPDRKNHVPIVSERLKWLRRSQYDVEYLIEAKKRGIINPLNVDGPTGWEKDIQKYNQAVRAIGEAL